MTWVLKVWQGDFHRASLSVHHKMYGARVTEPALLGERVLVCVRREPNGQMLALLSQRLP